MNKDMTIMVDRLKRIFPHLRMYNEGHEFGGGGVRVADDYAAPVDLDWFAVIAELEKKGLTIANKKDVGNKSVTNKRATNEGEEES